MSYLGWVGRAPMGQNGFFNLPTLAIKARHLHVHVHVGGSVLAEMACLLLNFHGVEGFEGPTLSYN